MPPVKKTPAKEDVVLKKEDDDSVNGEDVEVKVVLRDSKISRSRLVGRLNSFLKDGNPLVSGHE